MSTENNPVVPEGVDRRDLTAATIAATFAAKVIYIYASADSGHEGLLKIGDATVKGLSAIDGVQPNSEPLNNAAEARIRSYTCTQGANWQLLHTELAFQTVGEKRKGFRDYDVHDVLRNSGIEQVQPNDSNSREWFRTDLETAVKAIAAVKDGRLSLSPGEISADRTPVILRPEQERFVKDTIKAFKNADRYLWNAKMRFGKTVTALELVRRMGFKKTIIVTHRPVVNKGWLEDFRDKVFVRPEDNYVYGSKDIDASLDEICEHGAKNLVYFASIQDLRGSSALGGNYIKNEEIFATQWDCVIVDEAHEGTRTALGESVIQHLFPVKRNYPAKLLALSGTPFNILDSYKEGVSTWDYVMEQTAKRDWPLLHGGDSNPYETLPKLTMFVYDLAEELGGYRAEDVRGTVFNFKEFFRIWTGDRQIDHAEAPQDKIGCFVHETDVRRFLDLLVSPSASSCFPFASDENRKMFKHTLWLVPGVKEALALQRLIEGHNVLGFFKVLNVAGDGAPEDPTGEALKTALDGIATHEYTITLSCGKLTTGVTIPEWTAVLMLAGRYETSAIRYLQTIFRVQSPCERDGLVKENCYVFDFAPDRTLKVVADAASLSDSNRSSGGDDSDRRAAMGALLNFCPVISIKGSVMRRFNSDVLMQELKRAFAARAIMSGFADDSIYDDDMLRSDRIEIRDFEKLRKILKKAKIDDVPQDKFKVNWHGLTDEERERARLVQKKKPREFSEEERELLRRLREEREAKRSFKATLRAISVRMPLMLYGADGDWDADISLDRFVELVDNDSWAEFMPSGVTKAFFKKFKKYYDKDIFALSAKNIRRQAQGADELFPEERIHVIAEIFGPGRLRNPDKETVLTPWKTVNRQLADTLGGYVFFTPDFREEISVPRFVDQGEITAETMANPSAKMLEINSKTGLYPLYTVYSLYRARLTTQPATVAEANEIWDAVCRENMFVLALTPMAASITRRTLIGYRNALTRIKIMPKLVKRLKSNPDRVVSEVKKGTTWGLEDTIVFDAVVGNPPYQKKGENDGDRDNPIYHLFMDLAYSVSDKASLITPGRFLFNAGQTPKAWNAKMLNDLHFKVVRYWQKSDEVFPNVDIKGGVAVTYRDKSKNFGAIGVFSTFPELNSILKKVLERECRVCRDRTPMDVTCAFLPTMFDSIVSSQGVFRFSAKFLADNRKIAAELSGKGTGTKIVSKEFETMPKVFLESRPSEGDYIELVGRLGGARVSRFIRRDWLEVSEYLDCYKVFVPEANGTGAIGEVLSTPLIGEPLIGSTDTFISVGRFSASYEAENCMKYIKTKFARTMLGILKATQHNTKATWRYVPLPDFTSKSDIDWSCPIPKIDKQLYDKYGLTKSERTFIESMIKPME